MTNPLKVLSVHAKHDICVGTASSLNAYKVMQSAVVRYNPHQAEALKRACQEAGLPISGFEHPTPMSTEPIPPEKDKTPGKNANGTESSTQQERYTRGEKIWMGVTFILFLLLLLWIAVQNKTYLPQNWFIIRTILSLVGAAFAAVFIPGLLHIESQVLKNVVRVGGAAAVFYVIFQFNPPALTASDPPPEKTEIKTPTNSATSPEFPKKLIATLPTPASFAEWNLIVPPIADDKYNCTFSVRGAKSVVYDGKTNTSTGSTIIPLPIKQGTTAQIVSASGVYSLTLIDLPLMNYSGITEKYSPPSDGQFIFTVEKVR